MTRPLCKWHGPCESRHSYVTHTHIRGSVYTYAYIWRSVCDVAYVLTHACIHLLTWMSHVTSVHVSSHVYQGGSSVSHVWRRVYICVTCWHMLHVEGNHVTCWALHRHVWRRVYVYVTCCMWLHVTYICQMWHAVTLWSSSTCYMWHQHVNTCYMLTHACIHLLTWMSHVTYACTWMSHDKTWHDSFALASVTALIYEGVRVMSHTWRSVCDVACMLTHACIHLFDEWVCCGVCYSVLQWYVAVCVTVCCSGMLQYQTHGMLYHTWYHVFDTHVIRRVTQCVTNCIRSHTMCHELHQDTWDSWKLWWTIDTITCDGPLTYTVTCDMKLRPHNDGRDTSEQWEVNRPGRQGLACLPYVIR